MDNFTHCNSTTNEAEVPNKETTVTLKWNWEMLFFLLFLLLSSPVLSFASLIRCLLFPFFQIHCADKFGLFLEYLSMSLTLQTLSETEASFLKAVRQRKVTWTSHWQINSLEEKEPSIGGWNLRKDCESFGSPRRGVKIKVHRAKGFMDKDFSSDCLEELSIDEKRTKNRVLIINWNIISLKQSKRRCGKEGLWNRRWLWRNKSSIQIHLFKTMRNHK